MTKSKRKSLKEQKITCFSFKANIHRNNQRRKVDKLFEMKARSETPEKRVLYDFLARQKWRRIVQRANTMCDEEG
jgi:hypothetical protein